MKKPSKSESQQPSSGRTRRKSAPARQAGKKFDQYYRAVVQDQTEVISRFQVDGTLIFANDVFCRFFGKSLRELIGQKWHPTAVPDDLPQIETQLQQLSRSRPVVVIENRVYSGQGQIHWMQFVNRGFFTPQGRLKEVQSVGRDITDRKRIEEALRQSESRYRTLVESLPQRIFLKSKDYRFISVNEAFAQELHLRPADLVGKVDYDIYPRDLADKYRADDQRVMERGQPEEFEEQHLQDGKKIWVNTTKVPVRDRSGEINAIIGIFWDITDRKLEREQLQVSNQRLTTALTELRQTQAQIIQQEQLRGLGQMASGIAHNFNNALSPIIGFTELLLKNPEKRTDPELLEKWLQNIHLCATDAATMVRQIREFGLQRVASGEIYQLVDLNQLIQQTIELTAPHWKNQAQASGRTIQIETDFEPVPLIRGDQSGLRRMLTNLILNAVDFMPTGGIIRLETAVDRRFVRVRVIDTGTGMTAHTRQHCFEPFFSTKGTHGSGLGLSTVHGIVQRHGGKVAVASELGQGTTFSIRFPIPPGAPELPRPTTAGAVTKSLHILIVDDEPLVGEAVKASLNSDGHLVEIVDNGIAALTRLMNGQFDLVITDLAMPKMNGEQLAAAIFKSVPDLPVILMTGFGEILQAEGKTPPHVRALLSKPITQAALRAALTKIFSPH